MGQRSILIVAPHPDDETLGPGGVFAKRAGEGCRVTVVVLTDGSNLFRLSPLRIEVDPTPAETSAMRKEETCRAVEILGGRRDAVRFLDVEDGRLAEHAASAAEALAAILREVRPDEVYVTSEHENHPDHVAACGIVRDAMRRAGSGAALYRYVIALRPGLSLSAIAEPTVAVDVEGQLATKRRAVSQFASHLTLVARGQTEPFFRSVDHWLQPREVFFVDSQQDPG